MASRYLKALQAELETKMRVLADTASTINASLIYVSSGGAPEAEVKAAMVDAIDASKRQIETIYEMQGLLL